jgi:ATP-binding protein involved in chromosome partitioning
MPEAEVHIHFINEQESIKASGQTIKNIIAVGSGKGGVGKSTVSLNLALALKSLGAKVGILDADVYGPSLPTMLGITGQRPQVRELYGKSKLLPITVHGIETMSIGYIIEPDQAVVLRGPRLGSIIKQFFQECLWGDLDYLVVDLPPGTGDVQLTLVQTVAVTGAVIVTTPQEVALADARRAVNMFQLPNINVPLLGIVENMSWFTPAELPENKYYLFGKDGGKQLAKEYNTVLLGQVPLVQSIQEGADNGKPINAEEDGQHELTKAYFLKIAKNVAIQTAYRNETLEPTSISSIQ